MEKNSFLMIIAQIRLSSDRPFRQTRAEKPHSGRDGPKVTFLAIAEAVAVESKTSVFGRRP